MQIKKFKYSIFFIFCITLASYFLKNSNFRIIKNSDVFLIKKFVKTHLFPYRKISQQNNLIGKYESEFKKIRSYLLNLELDVKSVGTDIGISEIVKIKDNKYVVSSLKDKSLYFFELTKNRKLFNLKRVEVFERIRDLKYKDNKIYLFMEGTSSIGVIDQE